jgi:GPI-anchor transamidase subunit U
LFNPFTIASCLARTTSVITNTLILCAIAAASKGRSFAFITLLGLAAYLSLHPALLFPPLALLCYDQKRAKYPSLDAKTFTLTHVGGLVAVVSGLLYLSVLLTGSTQFLASTYGTPLLLPDLTPNVGLWWYFFTEMFDSFRNFFLGVFWLHMASYVGGLTIRLRTRPLFVSAILLGIFAVFQPYPSITDSALFLGMLPLFKHVFPRKFTKSTHYATTDRSSYEIPILGDSSVDVCFLARASILPSLDICRVWQRKFLLCHYSGLESWLHRRHLRFAVCGIER